MARIEWVKQRLENWALWKVREASGGMGFYNQSSFLKEATTADRYRESRIPVDEVDASVTDQAVQHMKQSRPPLYETLHAIYLEGSGIKGAARHAGVGESTIKARLEEADRALRTWFQERDERRKMLATR